MNLGNSMKKILGSTKYFFKKNAPTILLVGGVVTSIGAIVTASIASTKLEKTIKPSNEELDQIKNDEENKKISQKDAKKKRIGCYTKTGWKIIKLYSVPAIFYASSLGCFIGGHNVLSHRNAALVTSYAALQASYSQYKNKVEKYLKNEDSEEVTKDEKENQKKELVNYTKLPGSAFDFTFNRTVDGWDEDGRIGEAYLESKQTYFNRKLRCQGYITVYEVLKDMGVDPNVFTDEVLNASRCFGWISDDTKVGENEDTYVSLGLENPDGEPTIGKINMTKYGEKNFKVHFNNPYYIYPRIAHQRKTHY